MTNSIWRIAQDTENYEAHDLSGKGAEISGGRWNPKGVPLVYCSTSKSLAALETMVHLNAGGLPLNRYLVEVSIPQEVWEAAKTITQGDAPVGWDAKPPSMTSIQLGHDWIQSGESLLLSVPSVIVPDDQNILINPKHPDAPQVVAKKIRRWEYDPRLLAS